MSKQGDMKIQLTEDFLAEQPAIKWFKEIGYSYIHGSQLSPDNEERESYRHTVLKKRFIQAVKKLNPWLDDILAEKVYKKIIELEHPDFVFKGKLFYKMLKEGVKVSVKEDGRTRTKLVKIVDFKNPENNDFLIANQFTVEYQYQKEFYRRPDLVVFINGIPIAVFEFKSFNANETAKDAFDDHKVKMKDIPQLYVYSQIVVASDGLETKYGSPTSDWDRFFIWEGLFDDQDLKVREIEEGHYTYIYNGEEMTSLEVLIKGLFRKEHIVEFLSDFIYYEKTGESYDKKIAMFHQFYTVKKAVKRTLQAVLEGNRPENRRIGVVWHTQGTGKSLTMLFYARKVLEIPELENPLLLFITDRRNLDEQLSNKFEELKVAVRAKSINELQDLLKTKTGGIIFATIQKFGKRKAEEYPFLTDRKNIIVIADEAHRSQYRELAMNLRKAIPNASFMGFTATPIDKKDRSTTLVFGEPISIYTMEKARRHKVVVPIYYEARLSKLHLTNEFIDEEFEELTEDMEDVHKRGLLHRLEDKVLGSPDRLDKIARDIVEHFRNRSREFKGKAMIVTLSRKVAVELYKRIIKLPDAPSVAVVMSGSKQKDPPDYHPHLRSKKELEDFAKKFKNPDSDPQMVIVVDMWLTGFDVPCLHTMYFDRPMKDYSLVQAVARVNRVFKDKPGGLIVDYIGIADDLRKSLSVYTLDAAREILVNIKQVLDLLREKYDIVTSYFTGINFQNWPNLSSEELSRLTAKAYERISRDEDTKKRFVKNFIALKKLYALAAPHPEAFKIKNDLRFLEMIKKMVVKYSTRRTKTLRRHLEDEISELISRSIAAEEPVDIISLMGKEKPDISIFDDKFLAEFRKMEYKNYAVDLLSKILEDNLIVKMRRNPYRYKSLYEALNKLIEKYNIKLINTVEVIEELIKIAQQFRKASEEGKELQLTEEELAFYDLLTSTHSVFRNYDKIKQVAKAVVKELGYYVKVADWHKKEYIRARIKAALKRVLLKMMDVPVDYDEIERISSKIVNHAEEMYSAVA